jgi:ABC-type branched-subunit amino acid transport system ATPase component
VAEIAPRLAELNSAADRASADGGLVAKKITRCFGAVHAVDGVDIEIVPGSVVGVVGPNGSGKTTLINILSGYERSDAGAVWLNGSELKTASAVARAALGVGRTFQVPQLVEDLTLAENVMLGARGHPLATGIARALGLPPSGRAWRRRQQRAEDALDLVGLRDLAGLRAGRVSHGIRRRCEIAKVIVSRPTVVLLDEPGAGLSDVELENLAAIVRSVADGGAAVLLVDHNVAFLSRVSDYMILMNLGQKVFEGEPTAVLENDLTANVYFGSGPA